jgi:Ca2+-binding RTX toxin-like protein
LIGANEQAVRASPTIDVRDAVVIENQGYADVLIQLNAPSAGTVSASYRISGGTASDSGGASGDFTAVDGELVFDPGETTKVVRIEINDQDSYAEPATETIAFSLARVSGATVGRGAASIVIADEDYPATSNPLSFGLSNDTYVVDGTNDLVLEADYGGTDVVNSYISYTLERNVENLTLMGSASLSGTGNTLHNIITGNSGSNTLRGGAGKDKLDGGTGNDSADYSDKTTVVSVTLNGATNALVSVGGVAEDIIKKIENLIGGSAADRLTGDGLANALTGNGGNDTLSGGSGNDKLIGGAGKDTLLGMAGNDVFRGGSGKDILDGGTGTDTADYSDKTTAVSVTLNGATNAVVSVGGVAEDTIKKIENLIGGSAADRLTGDGLANVLTGNGGNDTLSGGAGNDRLIGGAGKDTLLGMAGNDVFKGGSGKDTLDGGTGTDTADHSDKTTAVSVRLNGPTNAVVSVGGVAEDTIKRIENLIGGSAADKLTGDSLGNRLTGNGGNDTLSGGGGNDTLIGGSGKDSLAGGAGDDKLYGDAGVDAMTGGTGNDTYHVDNTSDVVSESSDSVNGGIDAIFCTVSRTLGRYQDNLTLSGTADLSGTGNTLANKITGNTGNNTLRGGAGKDKLDGGTGN